MLLYQLWPCLHYWHHKSSVQWRPTIISHQENVLRFIISQKLYTTQKEKYYISFILKQKTKTQGAYRIYLKSLSSILEEPQVIGHTENRTCVRACARAQRCLCTCLFGWICMHVGNVHVCTRACRGQRSTSGFFWVSLHAIFWDQVSHWAWS